MCHEGAQVELYRERCVPKFLKLSSEVKECKPLALGCHELAAEKAIVARLSSVAGQCRLTL